MVAYEAGGESCRVMPVIGGDDILGSALLFHREPLEELAIRTFERSSSVIGIVLLSQHRMQATRNLSASALLRSLVSLRQDDLASLSNRAEQHGMDLARPLSLILVAMDGPRAGYAARHFGSHFGGQFHGQFGNTIGSIKAPPRALVDDIDGILVLLGEASSAPDLRQAVSAWLRQDLGAAHRGVQSRPVSAPAELPSVYACLRRALAVLARIGVNGKIVSQNELALYSTLFETHDQASLTNFLEASIGPLLSHDRKRGSELAVTLLAYFDCNQNAKSTAQRLNIHVNTVRQRLATTEDLVGHWGQASRALEIHVALRLWSLTTPSA